MNLFNQAAADTLRQNVGALPAKDQGFAHSLLGQLSNKSRLSDRQWAWVNKLVERLNQPAPAAPEAAISLADFSGVVALFQAAQAHLKYPHIRLQLEDGRPISLSVAGPSSRRPGTINVTDGGRYGSNVWYGRVTSDGTWETSGKADDETAALLATLLTELAQDPAGVAAKYGKLTGNCCFCNTELTDERSTGVGYGPVCAKKWALPWGKTAQ